MMLTQVPVALLLIGTLLVVGCVTPGPEQPGGNLTEVESRELARTFVEQSPT